MNIPALIGISVFYFIILFIGLLASCKKRWKYSIGGENEDMLAGRSFGCFLGSLSLTATWVGGVYISGTVERVYKQGVLHAQTPWGCALSLFIGGLIFAKKMRKEGHMTMLDPLQERYGSVMGGLLATPAFAGELFWSAAILSALGAVLSKIMDVKIEYAIIVSAFIVTMYTLVGGLYAVAYTDVFQLCFVFICLWMAIPFAMMHENVSKISTHDKGVWLGTMETANIGSWIDHALLLAFGRIPWQVYFQRVLSAKSGMYARVISFSAALGCLIVAIPVVMIGIIAKSTDWMAVLPRNNTNMLDKDGSIQDTRFLLVLVMEYLTPSWVSSVVLAGICAAVMSSVDSSILSSSSMMSYNIYKIIFRKKATPREVAWITRLGVLMAGVASGAVAILVKNIPDYWILSCDFVYVVLFPQLLCAVFLKFVNIYGSMSAVIISVLLRLGAGEPILCIPVFIKYPFFDEGKEVQVFPFRTLAMLVSILTLVLFSLIAEFAKPKTKEISQDEVDILRISYRDPQQEKSHSFSKISRYSGSYNNIAASATELRNRDDKALLRTSMTRRELEDCAEVVNI